MELVAAIKSLKKPHGQTFTQYFMDYRNYSFVVLLAVHFSS